MYLGSLKQLRINACFFFVSYRMLLHMNKFPTLWWSELKLSTQLATGVLIWFSIVVLVMIGWCLIIDAWIVNLSRCNLVPMFLNNDSQKLEKESCGGYMPSDFFLSWPTLQEFIRMSYTVVSITGVQVKSLGKPIQRFHCCNPTEFMSGVFLICYR